MSDIGVHYSVLSGNIYAGQVNRARTTFLGDKRLVTHEACAAVAEYVLAAYGEGPRDGLVLRASDGAGWEITVQRLPPKRQGHQS